MTEMTDEKLRELIQLRLAEVEEHEARYRDGTAMPTASFFQLKRRVALMQMLHDDGRSHVWGPAKTYPPTP